MVVKDRTLYWIIGVCILLIAACTPTVPVEPPAPPSLKWEMTYDPTPAYQAVGTVGKDGKEYITLELK